MESIKKTYKVYGWDGHRQKESFGSSYTWDFSQGDDIRIISVANSDKTGTNDYSMVTITRNTQLDCDRQIDGQISDGIFENFRTGKVTVVLDDGIEAEYIPLFARY